MKEITEKQIEAIKKLATATETEIENVEQMSRFEASKVIEGLIEKRRTPSQNNGSRNDAKPRSNGYRSGALAGLAVKTMAQRYKRVRDIVDGEDIFTQKVVELYRAFENAKRACFA